MFIFLIFKLNLFKSVSIGSIFVFSIVLLMGNLVLDIGFFFLCTREVFL